MKKQAKQWLHFSKVDLSTIEKIKDDEFLTQSAAFHSHQSVEKSLKAIIALYDRKIPKVHDLLLLIGIIEEINIEINIDQDILDSINQIYIDSRYPSDFGLLPSGIPTIEKINEFDNFARDIYNKVEKLIVDFQE